MKMPPKIAIVGSCDYPRPTMVAAFVASLPINAVIVFGGSTGRRPLCGGGRDHARVGDSDLPGRLERPGPKGRTAPQRADRRRIG